jgi:AbrB family looped-hinge helix DNA binding protein
MYDKKEKRMTTATIGSKYQVVIPSRERKLLGLKPHSKVLVEAMNDFIIVRPYRKKLRGIGKALANGQDATDYVKKLRKEWESRNL